MLTRALPSPRPFPLVLWYHSKYLPGCRLASAKITLSATVGSVPQYPDTKRSSRRLEPTGVEPGLLLLRWTVLPSTVFYRPTVLTSSCVIPIIFIFTLLFLLRYLLASSSSSSCKSFTIGSAKREPNTTYTYPYYLGELSGSKTRGLCWSL